MDEAKKPGLVQTMRIIVGALTFGVVVFTGVALIAGGDADNQTPVVTYLGVGLAVVMVLVVRPLVTALLDKAKRKELGDELGDRKAGYSAEYDEEAWKAQAEEELWKAYQTRTVVRSALLEGVGMLMGIALMTEKQLWVLPVQILLIVLLAFEIPSQERVEAWVRRQNEKMDMDVQFSN